MQMWTYITEQEIKASIERIRQLRKDEKMKRAIKKMKVDKNKES